MLTLNNVSNNYVDKIKLYIFSALYVCVCIQVFLSVKQTIYYKNKYLLIFKIFLLHSSIFIIFKYLLLNLNYIGKIDYRFSSQEFGINTNCIKINRYVVMLPII